ncbi:MAG TPA: aminomethyl-transferring glycine dehydrogenase, partial [Spirochaetia bacterium]|nr:aminomethyl-transferring glycine dehydrogenase [Spirochaetia bacterium]
HTPAVLQRGILENPGWYTAYTPYQAEISQGRLEALVNFQTLVCDLTGMDLAGASLLDEATAAAEAMTLCWRSRPRGSTARTFFVSQDCHPQVIDVVRTRAEPLGFTVKVGDPQAYDFAEPTFGVLVSYPDTRGRIVDPTDFFVRAHTAGAKTVVSADPLALTLLKTPGQCGADVAVGTSQRFGVPLAFGGPHAGFLAVKEALKRELPGRLVGVSKDVNGRPAYRLALQTREQHIRREAATSNICTAQVLLAVLASMYAVYHGPQGLGKIARRVRAQTRALGSVLEEAGWTVEPGVRFDTLVVTNLRPTDRVVEAARDRRINLRTFPDAAVGISLDETVTEADLTDLAAVFGLSVTDWAPRVAAAEAPFPPNLERTSPMLTHPVFHSYHTETEMMRYLHRLQAKDYSLVHGMIPLGSCTMKVNPAAAMLPITWPGFANLHPLVPADQARGYHKLFERLEAWLAEITGLAAVSLQPNSGAQGEYAGLLAIRGWHRSRGQGHRRVCLIPTSAHGTNPASAALAGMTVVPVACDAGGNVDRSDLAVRIAEHREDLAALMVTYPSTHGVFEESVVELCELVHEAGGQVYMDGANLNAQVGLTSPGFIGADVCHLNLHKTFSIPHGGGGPGVGPVAVAAHLVPFLPPRSGPGMVSAAPWGSAGILPIPYAAIALLGAEGLTEGSVTAIRNANELADRLEPHYPVLYRGARGRVAHECILDLRPLKASAGIEAEDVAKRLMDYGFHAPTLSFPVPGTLMVEPTESEPQAELDRFCEAMISIRREIRDIEEGRADRTHNLLKDAPFPVEVVTADVWDRPYTRAQAAWPVDSLRQSKFWPAVGRVDNVWG